MVSLNEYIKIRTDTKQHTLSCELHIKYNLEKNTLYIHTHSEIIHVHIQFLHFFGILLPHIVSDNG